MAVRLCHLKLLSIANQKCVQKGESVCSISNKRFNLHMLACFWLLSFPLVSADTCVLRKANSNTGLLDLLLFSEQ